MSETVRVCVRAFVSVRACAYEGVILCPVVRSFIFGACSCVLSGFITKKRNEWCICA